MTGASILANINNSDRRADRGRTSPTIPLALLAQPPAPGQLAIFDRSWYGRVLVERVEGFCSEQDWMRAYGEINDFEQQIGRNARWW